MRYRGSAVLCWRSSGKPTGRDVIAGRMSTRWRRLAAALAIMRQSAAPAEAQWAPGKTARLVVPFPPGGAADILARLLANQITQASGQGMVVENRPGGGTVIATEAVSRAAPDGTTLLLMANSFVINASLRSHLTYDPLTSFEHICFLAQSPHVLSVNVQVAVQDVCRLRGGGQSQARQADDRRRGARHHAPHRDRGAEALVGPRHHLRLVHRRRALGHQPDRRTCHGGADQLRRGQGELRQLAATAGGRARAAAQGAAGRFRRSPSSAIPT